MHIQPRELRATLRPAVESEAGPIPGELNEANGGVTLCLDGSTLICGELLDVSPTGFRIRYRGEAPPLLLEVEIFYLWGKVNAMVTSVSRTTNWIEANFVMTA